MAQQDLTPQLRTRLNRVERAVGIFGMLAVLLLLGAFGYYVYFTAEQRGWFEPRAAFFTYLNSGAGIHVGDEVTLMGFPAGHITLVKPMQAWGATHNVYVEFEVQGDSIGYLWTQGSKANWEDKLFPAGRQLDLTKGTGGVGIYLIYPLRQKTIDEVRDLPHLDKWRLAEEIYAGTNIDTKAFAQITTNLLEHLAGMGKKDIWVVDSSVKRRRVTAMWNGDLHRWETASKTNRFELPGNEPVQLTDRLNAMLTQVEHALPGILDMTNRINAVLSNSVTLTSNLNTVATDVRPAIANLEPITTNLAFITSNLRDPHGSLGEWVIPTNLQDRLNTTLITSGATLTNVNTNFVVLADSLTRALNNLGDITSNLNAQVQANSNMLSQISSIVVHSDEFVQGLKRHWLLRSAFKTKPTNAPPAEAKPEEPLLSPKAKSNR